ncbi:MAG: GAF domain-containing protein [Gammaproteobacteria bacterium]|nr:GAF domain-containing protein [Gammaproteobacteria bacterium]
MNATEKQESALKTEICESERLHLSGKIQGYGILIQVDMGSGVITHVSDNIRDLDGLTPEALCGQPLSCLPWLEREIPPQLPGRVGPFRQIHRLVTTKTTAYDAVLIENGSALLLELEPTPQQQEMIQIWEYERDLHQLPTVAEELPHYHNDTLSSIQSIIGFDRVMVYRFHSDWSGEVIAEVCNPEHGSYLGLHFPASDIPAIARNLYQINSCRLIADTRAEAVAIHGENGTPPDLTYSDLRSVSEMHLAYLDNMGVRASFSVPIIVNQRLWGLISCHHLQPRYLNRNQRAVCASLIKTYSLALSTYYTSYRVKQMDSLERRIDTVLEAISLYSNPLEGVEQQSNLLLESLGADGIAMAYHDDVVIVGEAPDLQEMSEIDDWFLNRQESSLVTIDNLSSEFELSQTLLARTSGLLAIRARSPRSGWVRIYWFRQEEIQEVPWAGNPNKPFAEDASATTLSPRRSFEKWIEIRRGYSRPWSHEDRLTAGRFRNTLLRWL